MQRHQQRDATLPEKMRALQLIERVQGKFPAEAEAYDQYFRVAEVDVPQPKAAEVLVRVERSPINPSDLSSLRGSYDAANAAKLPYIGGFEGSGTVVASGGGLLAWRVMGKRVAMVSGQKGGCWAQYVCTPAMMCMPLPDDASFDVGASCFVNPLTVLAFIELAHAGGHKTIVHTAAASALGKMLIRAAQREGIQVIGVVRKEEQVEELKALGALQVFNSQKDQWEDEFKACCSEHNCRLAFDAVAGPLTGKILHAMPHGSVVKVYGGLSEQLCSISPGDLIFQGKKAEGFWLTSYIRTKNPVGLYMWQRKVAALINSDLKSDVRGVFTLDRAGEALGAYTTDMSAGKVLFAPNLGEAGEGSASSSAGLAVKVEEEATAEEENGKGKEKNEGEEEEKQ